MAVKEHQLFNELWENVRVWVMPEIEERIKREGYQVLFGPTKLVLEFSPKQNYEYNSCYWCVRLLDAFDRLRYIRNMTRRSLYRKKSEEKSVLLQEWLIYNYEHYVIVYQGVLDIALLLTNALFDMGNPPDKCSYSTICDNTRIAGTEVGAILKKLIKTVRKHREGKNLLVHRGGRIELPIQVRMPSEVDLLYVSIKLGIEVKDELRDLLAEFLTIHTRKDLLAIMDKEFKQIESQVEKLFDELLPVYRGMRSFYS